MPQQPMQPFGKNRKRVPSYLDLSEGEKISNTLVLLTVAGFKMRLVYPGRESVMILSADPTTPFTR